MDIKEAIQHCREVAAGWTERGKCSECAADHSQLSDWLERLVAYMETGLEPETVVQLKQIAEIFNYDPGDPAQLKGLLDKLRAWQKAEQDGRLVVLPCKPGDVVYFPVAGRWDSATIEHIEVWSTGVRFFWVQYDIGPETNELWDDGDFEMDDIGKTVFLTRQEAEAALEQMKGKGENG